MLVLASQFDKDAASTHVSQIRCGFEAEFASRIGRREFANLLYRSVPGARNVKVSNKYGASHGGSYTNWSVEADNSIAKEPGYATQIECVSPIFELDGMLARMKEVFALIEEVGVTNNSTGLHVTFSFDDMSLSDAKFDPLKLLLFLGEDYSARLFGRQSNSYASQVIPSLRNALARWAENHKKTATYKDVLEAVSRFNAQGIAAVKEADDDGSLAKEIARVIFYGDRQRTVNLSHMLSRDSSRVEFRLMGGADYHKKFAQVERLVRRFTYAMWASCSKSSGKYTEEYAQKLWRVVRDSAGDHTNVLEVNHSKFTLKPMAGMSTRTTLAYEIEHRFTLKDHMGKPQQDTIAVAYFDRAGRTQGINPATGNDAETLFKAVQAGQINRPDGTPLDLADLVAAQNFKEADYALLTMVTEFLGGKDTESFSVCVERVKSVEPVLLSRYGKLGQEMMARIVFHIMLNSFVFQCENSNGAPKPLVNDALASGDFTKLKADYELYLSYAKRYSKLAKPEGSSVSLAHDDLPLPSYMKSVVEVEEDYIELNFAFKRMLRISSTTWAPRLSKISTATALALQLAMGRKDLATVTALSFMYYPALREPDAMLSDWSFLDPRAIRACPTIFQRPDSKSGPCAVFSREIPSIAHKPKGFLAKYLPYAKPADAQVLYKQYLLHTAPTLTINSDDTWTPVTGIPKLDKAIKDTFGLLVKVSNTKPASNLQLLNDSGYVRKGALYSFCTRSPEEAKAALASTPILEPGAVKRPLYYQFTQALFASQTTRAELPANDGLKEALLTDKTLRANIVSAMLVSSNVSHKLTRDFMGIEHVSFAEGLFNCDYIAELLSVITTYSTYMIDIIDFFRCALASGVPLDFILGIHGLRWFTVVTQSPISHIVSSYELFKFLLDSHIMSEVNGVATVNHTVESPLIAAIFKKHKYTTQEIPAIAGVLPEGYKPNIAKLLK